MTRLGMVLYHGIESGPQLKEYATLAEAAGYESLWVTERYFHEETFALLGFLAALTRTMKLGVGVTNPYTRHPALLAMASATLDRICGGRFLLGLGRSERAVIQERMGIPYGPPRATLAEAVGMIRALLAGQRVNTTAGRLTLRDARLAITPIQQALPIYVAAIGPKALRLAGAVADGVLLNAYVPPGYVRYAVQEVREAARAAGRDPQAIDIACMLVVRLTNDLGQMLLRGFGGKEGGIAEFQFCDLQRGAFDSKRLNVPFTDRIRDDGVLERHLQPMRRKQLLHRFSGLIHGGAGFRQRPVEEGKLGADDVTEL